MTDSKLVAAIRAIVRALDPNRAFADVYRYRAVKMAVDRVVLQAVVPKKGLPDIPLADEWCGVPGAWATLTLGTEVLVEFTEGNATRPVIVGFAPKGSAAFRPAHVEFDAVDYLRLGKTATEVIVGADAGSPLAVARAAGTQASLDALAAKVNAIIAFLGTGTPGVTPILATAALLPTVSGMTADPSTKLKAV